MKTTFSTNFLFVLVFCFLFKNSIFSQNSSVVTNTNLSARISIESLPLDLPVKTTILINYKGERLSLVLEKSTVFGGNTKCLIDDGTGKLIEVPMNVERSYLGTVTEYNDSSVSAVLTDNGLIANIYRPNKSTIQISPLGIDSKMHRISEVKKAHTCGTHCNISENSNSHTELDVHLSNSEELKLQPSTSAIFSKIYANKKMMMPNSSATLKPSNIMEVFEFEIGVEIGSKSFLSNSAYKGNLSTAQASAQSIVGNLNSRFLSATGVRFKLGTVIIRTNASTDPLRNLVTGTGTSSTARKSLEAFRDYWNNNPSEVGTTHDLAVYHVASAPSGLAYVGGIGRAGGRYATLGGRGATSWADGTAAHEVGHLFGLGHVNQTRFFYEARPRLGAGADTAGGNEFFISIMDGRGRHNIGRMATSEAQTVIGLKNRAKSSADIIKNLNNVRPYGMYDEVVIPASQTSILIDVVQNDYDANNDVLDVRVLDKISFKGGEISLSQGTGPGGRNQLKYTLPSNFSGQDFFHYTVFDPNGGSNFGAVYLTREVSIDPNSELVRFDFGTDRSPLFTDYIRVDNTTQNTDFGWIDTLDLFSIDNGNSGANALNRDYIYSQQTKTFEAKIKNGIWDAVITVGPLTDTSSKMTIKANGGVNVTDIVTPEPSKVFNQVLRIEIKDEKLSLEFSQNGGFAKFWTVTRVNLLRVGDLPDNTLNVNDINLTSKDKQLMYPNPAKNTTLVSNLNKGDTITIMDLSGKIVKNIKATSNTQQINLLGILPGIYLVKINTNGVIYKLVIK